MYYIYIYIFMNLFTCVFIDLNKQILTGPCAGIPSRLHANTIEAMMRNLDEIRPGFDVMHEFSGIYIQIIYILYGYLYTDI
jgi:hypothetical protein